MPKKSLRRQMLEKRKSLSPREGEQAGLLVQRAFLASAEFAGAQVLALYAPIQREVGTEKVALAALSAGKAVLYPAVSGDSLVFRRVADVAELRKGAFGIGEPDAANEPFVPSAADVIVIPGVAFDLKGHRIGYGKGYYDRALHTLEGKGRLVGFCYEFQLVDEIAGEPHDVRVDKIITEKRIIRCRD